MARKWNYSSLKPTARKNLKAGLSVWGEELGPDTWINPHFNPDRSSAGYTRFDPAAGTGVGLERALTYYDGARIFDAYKKQGSPYYNDAINWLRSHGKDTSNLTDAQKFRAIDAAFRGGQAKNQRPKRSFGVGDLIGGLAGPVAGLLTGNPALAAGIGALGGGITKGPLGALTGAAGGYFAGGGSLGGIKNALTGGASPGAFAGYSSQFSPAYTGALGPASGGIGNALAGSGAAFGGKLGIGAKDLYNPASLGGPTSGSYSIPGGGFVNPGGLGITPNLAGGIATPGISPPVAIPGAGWGGTTTIPGGGFINPSALGGSPADVFPSTGAGAAGGSSLLNRGAGSALRGALGALGGAAPAVGGGDSPAPAGAAGIPLLGAGGSFGGVSGPGNFEFPLGAQGSGGLPSANALRATAGAGKMPARPGRVPGYQYRPFANFVM